MKTAAAWTQDYALGIAEIDEQHRLVFEQIDALSAAVARLDERRAIDECLTRLIDYIRVHLVMEEYAMRLLVYPEYTAHKRLHDAALIELEIFLQRHHAGEQRLNETFVAYLTQGWRQHILEGDAQYVRALKSQGVAGRWSVGLGGLLGQWRRAVGHGTATGR
ncbi:bacteriohemerythrin [Acidihalobacter prosperus]|uniref:Hemerythrin-like domain-containing protein n=1 Tax=Acidihalobacter prosperus TaxID=160660 RepID=A0A1A6C7P3_9GAMM|nr:bacteriohemerythrin [Acidihalobacter prosperus]OBS10581.1 hypothetical protein Thpro_020297 [Acidihalobacter prosperus]